MSPELETLDQLLGGALSLRVIQPLYRNAEAFKLGVIGLLASGDVILLASDQSEVPSWRWRELFADDAAPMELGNLTLRITTKGTQRIG